MSYQLPPLSNEYEFERLVRDILRRDYDDPGIERFGRKGQSQFGIDGFSNSGVTFQCKLKDVSFKDAEQLRNILLSEMEEELEKTKGLTVPLKRFIFATTFKNDRHLQEKAASLSNDSLTVEYWGWDTISEKIREYAEYLIPIYYPEFPIGQVPGFAPITLNLIAKLQTNNTEELNKLALEYYRINDRSEVVLRVVCNDIDVRNEKVMHYTFGRLEALPPSGTLWILGYGGSGKTTILNRLAVELAERKRNVYMLNLEMHISNDDLEKILLWLKYSSASEPTVLCIDNPAADEEILEILLRRIPDYCPEIHILLAERDHRYKTLKRTGALTYLHGEEEEHIPVHVHNPSDQRHKVYRRLFDLLGISETDRAPLMEIALNERIVYVNATYRILLELKRKRIIDFDFDWDDYRKTTADLPAFTKCYKYIALFYLFGVKTPFTVLSKIFGADETQRQTFLERFRGLVDEPIILDERRDDSFRKSIYVRTKHEIVSEIFFEEYRENKDELLMEWCERTDFGDTLEVQALINIFGAKKNYTDENPYINFAELIDFLLQGHIHEKVVLSPKLNATLHTAKFWLLKMQKKSAEAIEILETFLESAPDDLHGRTELAKAYINEGRLAGAETVLLKILDIKADDLNSRIELAKVYQKQDKLTEAETVLQKLLEIEKRSIRANTELAKIYQRQNKLAEAESILLDVLEVKPKDLQSRTELSKIYQRQGKLTEAEAVLIKILDIKPEDLPSRTELAKIYQRQGKLAEAEAVLLKSLEIDPDHLHARTELAKIYRRQIKLDKAEAILLESLEIDSKQIHPRTELAKIYQRQFKLAEAENLLLEILDIKPKDLQSRTELAKIYQRQNKLDKAEAILLESLEIDSKQLHPRTELAKIYQRQNKLDKAEAILLESLDIDSKQLHPRTELAKIYQRQGRWDEAIQRLEEYIELDSKGLHPRLELARIYQRQGKFDDAAKRLEEVLTLDSLNDHAISELLAIWKQRKEKEKCVQRFLEFVDQPNYQFSRFSQAPVFRFFQCCLAFNMRESAQQVFERFKSELDEQNINYYTRNFK